MQLVAWIAVCLVVAYGLRRRPLVLVLASLTLWVAVPAAAGELLTGRSSGPLGFHPAVWLVGASVGFQLLENPRAAVEVIGRHVYLALVLVLTIGVAGLTTFLSGSGGLALVVGQMVGPVLLFLLILATATDDERTVAAVRTALLALGSGSAALAVVQWLAGDLLIYEDQFATRWWFARPDFDRWMGTLDHPLVLSFFLCAVAPLAAGIRRPWLQLATLMLLSAGVVITQSRSGVVIMAAVLAYAVSRSRAGATTRLTLYFLLAAGVVLALASGLAAGVTERFEDDTGSTEARVSAVTFFADTWQDYAIVGSGFSSSYRVASGGGLETSLESSVMMYAVDIGLVFALLYFGGQAVIVLNGTRRGPVPGLIVSGVVVLLLPHTFSALASGNAVGALLWTVLASIVALRDRGAPAVSGPGHPVDRSESRQWVPVVTDTLR